MTRYLPKKIKQTKKLKDELFWSTDQLNAVQLGWEGIQPRDNQALLDNSAAEKREKVVG